MKVEMFKNQEKGERGRNRRDNQKGRKSEVIITRSMSYNREYVELVRR